VRRPVCGKGSWGPKKRCIRWGSPPHLSTARGGSDAAFVKLLLPCVISRDSYGPFLAYGSVVAFFAPLSVMMVTYALTTSLLRRRAVQAERLAREGSLRRTTSQRHRRRHRPQRQDSCHYSAATVRVFANRLPAGLIICRRNEKLLNT